MKKSIRRQMVVVFVGLITFILLLIFIVNSSFLEQYYLVHKQEDLTTIFSMLDKVAENPKELDDRLVDRFRRQSEKGNIYVLIVSPDGHVGYSTIGDTLDPQSEELYFKALAYVFDKKEHFGKTLETTENYIVYKTQDVKSLLEYVELVGSLQDGSVIVVRSPIESIRESADLANKFLVYIGIIAIGLGGLLVWFFSNKIARPIKELAALSQKMADLDFNARYTSGGENEIGVLVNNFNAMSERLEKTISELKSANNKLQKDIEQKEKIENMRTEFLGNVSHELKTPIALIQGYAEGLKEGISEDVESREFYCDVIIDEASKMNLMVRNLLTLNQLEFGDDGLTIERFDITALVRGVLSSCELLFQQAGATVDFIADDSIYVWADEFKTEQVVRNYITNAINHVENEKRIEIRIISKEDVVRVTVFNSGKPIPEEDVEKLWDKFYKVDKSHTRQYGGNGIGLSIVKAIMESFHRDYGVTNFENGVEFWFELDARKS